MIYRGSRPLPTVTPDEQDMRAGIGFYKISAAAKKAAAAPTMLTPLDEAPLVPVGLGAL